MTLIRCYKCQKWDWFECMSDEYGGEYCGDFVPSVPDEDEEELRRELAELVRTRGDVWKRW